MPSLLKPSERARLRQQFAAIRQMPAPIPARERYRYSIEQVGIGGYVRFEDRTYRVTGTNAYERKGFRWPELILYRLEDGSKQYLEWEKEDEVSVYVSREKLSFEQVGLKDKERLWRMSEAGKGSLEYAGTSYHYHEDSRVKFFRDGSGSGRPFHQYLFANHDRSAFLGIEEWGSEASGFEHNVILSGFLDPHAIEILVTGGAAA